MHSLECSVSGHTGAMAGAKWRVDRLVEDVTRLGARGLPREEYYAEVTARLRRVVPNAAACWHTIDPHTHLLTSDSPTELISRGVLTVEGAAVAGEGIIASEYLAEDVNTFASLARKRVPVGVLSQATGGKLERSRRYRHVLRPAGIPHELRAAFVTRGRCWGAVHIARRDGEPDFTAHDVSALASITALVAEGIRGSLRLDASRRSGADGTSPGLMLLGPGNEVELITPPARELLDLMPSGLRCADREIPPGAVLALAEYTRRTAAGDGDEARTVAVPTGEGWLTLHASLPDGGTAGRVAIVLERSASPASTAVRLEAHGVTSREREIAALMAAGLTNPEIAERLVLSPYTVQDHIKSLFEKTSVSSRQELVARIFLDDYLPLVKARTPVDPTGQFTRG
jgi:DNA-binding CsgD family transcriptional regulator